MANSFEVDPHLLEGLEEQCRAAIVSGPYLEYRSQLTPDGVIAPFEYVRGTPLPRGIKVGRLAVSLRYDPSDPATKGKLEDLYRDNYLARFENLAASMRDSQGRDLLDSYFGSLHVTHALVTARSAARVAIGQVEGGEILSVDMTIGEQRPMLSTVAVNRLTVDSPVEEGAIIYRVEGQLSDVSMKGSTMQMVEAYRLCSAIAGSRVASRLLFRAYSPDELAREFSNLHTFTQGVYDTSQVDEAIEAVRVARASDPKDSVVDEARVQRLTSFAASMV